MPSSPTFHTAESSTPSPSLVRRSRRAIVRPAWAFMPFVVVSATHLVLLLFGIAEAAIATKWLLMPALIVAVLLASPARRATATVVLVLAITFSWLGDISLLAPGSPYFVMGLSFFLIAHLAYLGLFTRGLGLTRPRLWALVYVAWWLVFVVVLGPSTGPLLIPVAIYGLVLGAMAAFASRGSVLLAIGGALFLVSDTVLGSSMFLEGFMLWNPSFVIMLTYLAAQGLIAWAVVAVQNRHAGEQAPVSRSAAHG